MGKIKERAKEALNKYDYNIYYHCSELTEDSFVDGYVEGATEQHKIDVEKACGILWGMCLTRRHEFKTYKDVITVFRKAMED